MTEKIRKCLGPECGKEFWSEHAGNRICDDCKKLNMIQNPISNVDKFSAQRKSPNARIGVEHD